MAGAAAGGPPRRILTNAEGLTWFTEATGQRRVLFSEMTGLGGQMSIVSATETRSDPRNVYVPPPPAGMAHRSYLSPDRRWALVIEMDNHSWLPCRLVPFDGRSPGTQVGPSPSQCTDAAWSPDGTWMYFTAMTASGIHIWRQRFPDGTPQQITSGAVTEEGIHFPPDGRLSSGRSARRRAPCGCTMDGAISRSLRTPTSSCRSSHRTE